MGFPNNKITNGLSGGIYIADTTARTGDWLAIQVLADAKFHTLTGNITNGIANTTDGSAPVIPAGTVLFGKFTAIDLHSGRIIAYTA
jgi:hypothetical protein